MKKCTKCGRELPKTPQKTLKIAKLGIEVETRAHDGGKKLSEIQIPKGWRLLRVNEVIALHNDKKLRKQLGMENTWEFIEQPFEFNKEKGYVARWNAGSGWAGLSCSCDVQDSDPGLRVRFCREVGKRKR